MKPYALNRVGRALFASGIAYTATDKLSILPTAFTEMSSFAYEMYYILPYFGNIMWLTLLFPNILKVYNDVFFYNKKKNSLKERKLLFVLISLQVIYLCVKDVIVYKSIN